VIIVMVRYVGSARLPWRPEWIFGQNGRIRRKWVGTAKGIFGTNAELYEWE
jgi:hypothetical protein